MEQVLFPRVDPLDVFAEMLEEELHDPPVGIMETVMVEFENAGFYVIEQEPAGSHGRAPTSSLVAMDHHVPAMLVVIEEIHDLVKMGLIEKVKRAARVLDIVKLQA
jgi:hypothetical protein